MKKILQKRKFTYVAFFSQCAWVAGATDVNQVSQGSTFDQAVFRLNELLKMRLIWDQSDDIKPFEDDKGVQEDFKSTSGCILVTDANKNFVKGVRYVGEMTVIWDPKVRVGKVDRNSSNKRTKNRNRTLKS